MENQITNNEWELCKENIQPLKSGRQMSSLKKALNPVCSDSVLRDEKQNFEMQLRSTSKEKQLDVWVRYVQYMEQLSLSSKPSRRVLKRSIETLDAKLFKDNEDYVRLWIKLADQTDEPSLIFDYMMDQEIGVSTGIFYQYWAEFFEINGQVKKADSLYQLGINRNVENTELLKECKEQFEMRMAKKKGPDSDRQAQDNTDSGPRRKVLGTLKVQKSGRVGSERIKNLGSKSALKERSKPKSNGKSGEFSIFSDNRAAPILKEEGSNQITTLPTKSSHIKENVKPMEKMKGMKIKNAGGTIIQSNKFEIYREEAKNLAENPTPKQVVLSARKPLSSRKEKEDDNPYKFYIPKKPSENQAVVEKYCKNVIYLGDSEVSFEELKAQLPKYNNTMRKAAKSKLSFNKNSQEVQHSGNQKQIEDFEPIADDTTTNIMRGGPHSALDETKNELTIGMPLYESTACIKRNGQIGSAFERGNVKCSIDHNDSVLNHKNTESIKRLAELQKPVFFAKKEQKDNISQIEGMETDCQVNLKNTIPDYMYNKSNGQYTNEMIAELDKTHMLPYKSQRIRNDTLIEHMETDCAAKCESKNLSWNSQKEKQNNYIGVGLNNRSVFRIQSQESDSEMNNDNEIEPMETDIQVKDQMRVLENSDLRFSSDRYQKSYRDISKNYGNATNNNSLTTQLNKLGLSETTNNDIKVNENPVENSTLLHKSDNFHLVSHQNAFNPQSNKHDQARDNMDKKEIAPLENSEKVNALKALTDEDDNLSFMNFDNLGPEQSNETLKPRGELKKNVHKSENLNSICNQDISNRQSKFLQLSGKFNEKNITPLQNKDKVSAFKALADEDDDMFESFLNFDKLDAGKNDKNLKGFSKLSVNQSKANKCQEPVKNFHSKISKSGQPFSPFISSADQSLYAPSPTVNTKHAIHSVDKFFDRSLCQDSFDISFGNDVPDIVEDDLQKHFFKKPSNQGFGFEIFKDNATNLNPAKQQNSINNVSTETSTANPPFAIYSDLNQSNSNKENPRPSSDFSNKKRIEKSLDNTSKGEGISSARKGFKVFEDNPISNAMVNDNPISNSVSGVNKPYKRLAESNIGAFAKVPSQQKTSAFQIYQDSGEKGFGAETSKHSIEMKKDNTNARDVESKDMELGFADNQTIFGSRFSSTAINKTEIPLNHELSAIDNILSRSCEDPVSMSRDLSVIEEKSNEDESVLNPFNQSYKIKCFKRVYDKIIHFKKFLQFTGPLPKLRGDRADIDLGPKNIRINNVIRKDDFSTTYKGFNEQNELISLQISTKENNPLWDFYICNEIGMRISKIQPPFPNMNLNYIRHNFACKFSDAVCIETPSYREGTLQDLIDLYQKYNRFIDEVLCMLYTREILSIILTLHKMNIIHTNIRPHVFLQLDSSFTNAGPSALRCLTLRSFEQSIDLTQFANPELVKFTSPHNDDVYDCREKRENKPWRYQVDYHAAASTIHMLVFQRPMNTYIDPETNLSKISSKPHRDWNAELWMTVFSTLINAKSEEGVIQLLQPLTHILEQPDMVQELEAALLSKSDLLMDD